jgi:hypothetical protein
MSTFTGLLYIVYGESILELEPISTGRFRLLLAGISDPGRAMAAATQFLLRDRNLSSGQRINVDGERGIIGTIPFIWMTDARLWQGAPEIRPEVITEVAPEVVSEVAPERPRKRPRRGIVSEVAPEIRPEVLTEVAPEVVSEVAPERPRKRPRRGIISEVKPRIRPEVITEVAPEIRRIHPDVVAEVAPERTEAKYPNRRRRTSARRSGKSGSRGGRTSRASREQEPRWIMANVFDLSAAGAQKPTRAFRAGASHEIRVVIGAEHEDWLVARGRNPSESIDSMLPKGTHQLTVVFFMPALGIHETGTLTLPPTGPTPEPAVFRFDVGATDSPIEVLISIVYRGRVLQIALLSGKAVADPLEVPEVDRITLRLQVVVPGFGDLGRREAFDAALVTATGTTHAAVATGVVDSPAGQGKTVVFDQPRIDFAAQAIRTVLEDVLTDDSPVGQLDSEATRTLLWKLAQQGRLLYDVIGTRLEAELSGRDVSRLQLVQADTSAFVPIEFIYELPPPANGAGLCKNWKQALAGKKCTSRHHGTDALGLLKVVCPSGFWSISKVIERQALKDLTDEEMRKSDFGIRAEPSTQRPKLPPIRSALFAWSDILDNNSRGTHAAVLKSLNKATRQHTSPVKTWVNWAAAIDKHRPELLVLLSHTANDALEIGPEDSGEIATLAQINTRFVKKGDHDAPIVFLLGCTTGVADDKLLSFAGRFRDQGAAIVVGTITPVLGERSAAVVKAVVAKLAQKRLKPARFGELMRKARRDLLSRGEITALCATSFGDASWLVR